MGHGLSGARSRRRISGLVVLIATTLLAVGHLSTIGLLDASAANSSSFVTRSGNELILDGKQFRFSGANMPWLGVDQDISDASGQPSNPTRFRIDNGLRSAAAMNATVVRAHTLGISTGCSNCLEPKLGVFNDKAFESIDYAIETAARYNIRFIIPLTDMWSYPAGGKHNFTEWNGYPSLPGKTARDADQRLIEHNFYTDPKVIASFKQYISYLLNHVDPRTGVALKDNPTVLAWETGNEIWDAPPSWTENIASHIKTTVGARQLVADGIGASGTASSGARVANMGAALRNPSVDMISAHFYTDIAEGRDSDYFRVASQFVAADAAAAKAANKVYFIGEYDWTGNSGASDMSQLKALLSTVASDRNVSGDLYWTLFPYKEDGSPEVYGERYWMLNPAKADDSRMVAANRALSAHAAAMNNGVSPALPPPSVPATPVPPAVTAPSAPPPPPSTPTPTTPKPPLATPGVLATGTHNDSSLAYSDGWETATGSSKHNNDDHYSQTAEATARATFDGRQLIAYGATAPHHGIVGVKIDEGAETLVDLYSAQRKDNVPFFTSATLANGKHTIEIRTTGLRNPRSLGTVIAVDRLDVLGSTALPSGTVSAGSHDDSSLTYSGGWQTADGDAKYQGGDHYSSEPDATTRVVFVGNRITLYGALAPHHGNVGVSIDGGPETTISQYAASRRDAVAFFTSGELTTGTHTAEIRVTGTKAIPSSGIVVALDRIDVAGG